MHLSKQSGNEWPGDGRMRRVCACTPVHHAQTVRGRVAGARPCCADAAMTDAERAEKAAKKSARLANIAKLSIAMESMDVPVPKASPSPPDPPLEVAAAPTAPSVVGRCCLTPG